MSTDILSTDTADREIGCVPISHPSPDVHEADETVGFEGEEDLYVESVPERFWLWLQIVTALKMAIWLVFFFPIILPTRIVKVGLLLILKALTKLVTKIHAGYLRIQEIIEDLWVDFKKGCKWVIKKCSLVDLVAGATFLVASSSFIGIFNMLVVLVLLVTVLGIRFGYKVPAHLRHYLHTMTREWGKLADGDDDSVEECVETKIRDRVKKDVFPALACKVAVRAISTVGLLKPTEANAMVYQRVCLDVMEGLRFRHYDRLRILPLAVLACLERPEEVDEVEEVVSILCGANSYSSE